MKPVEFLRAWFGDRGPYSVGAIESEGKDHAWFTTRDHAKLEAWLDKYAAKEWNLYFQPNVCHADLGTARARASNVVLAVCAHVEIDPPKDLTSFTELTAWQQSTLERLDRTNGLPESSFVYFSGTGYVVLFQLSENIPLRTPSDKEEIEAKNRGLVKILGGDPASTDVSRLLRLPGTVNYPSKDKKARGRVGPELTTIIHNRLGTEVPLAALPGTRRVLIDRSEVTPVVYAAGDLRGQAIQLLGDNWPVASRHHAHLALAGALARGGWNEDQITDFLVAVAEVQDPSNGDPPKRRETARSSFEKAADGMITGWPTLERHVARDVLQRVRKLLGFEFATDDVDEELFDEIKTAARELHPQLPVIEPHEEVLLEELRAEIRELAKATNKTVPKRDRMYLDRLAKGKPLTDTSESADVALNRAITALATHANQKATVPTLAKLVAGSALNVSMDTAMKKLEAARRRALADAPKPVDDANPVDEFAVYLSGPKMGQPLDNAHNWGIALARLGVTFRRNEFAYQTEIMRNGSNEILEDRQVQGLRFEIEKKFGFRPSKDDWYAFCDDLGYNNGYHPVKDYFEELPTWDGVPRLERWMVDYLGVADNEYTRAISKILLTAMVTRIYSPGEKYDEMVVLYGGQGVEKSSALRMLLPNEDWFTDALGMDEESKIVLEQTAGKLLVEVQELKTSSKYDERNNKAMLSRKSDRSRMAFGRKTEERFRQFVMCGTTNKRQFLKDPTGNRRFWPVIVGLVQLELLCKNRDLLWAEAVACYQAGFSIRLEKHLWEEAKKVQTAFTVYDPVTIRIVDSIGEMPGQIRLGDIWKILGHGDKPPNNNENERIVDAMHTLGFERVEGVKTLLNYYARGEGPERNAIIEVQAKPFGDGFEIKYRGAVVRQDDGPNLEGLDGNGN